MYTGISIYDKKQTWWNLFDVSVCVVRKIDYVDIYIDSKGDYVYLGALDWENLTVHLQAHKGLKGLIFTGATILNQRVINGDTILSIRGNVK